MHKAEGDGVCIRGEYRGNDVKAIYFSPTNTTKAIIEKISYGLGQNNPSRINLSNVEEQEDFFRNSERFADDTDFFL
jgi:hypothetical protein